MSSPVPRTPRIVPLPAGSLAKMAKQYTPFSVRHTFNVGTKNSNGLEVAPDQEVKAMKVFFDNKVVEFRMYGSPEEHWEQIRNYIDFQGNNKYFQLDPSIHYNHTLRIYPDIHRKKEYIQKNDIFLYIQNYLLQKEDLLKMRISLIMLSYYFQSEEKKLGETCEFVIFDKEDFEGLDSDLFQLITKMRRPNIKLPAMEFTWKKVFTKFQKLLPVAMNETEMAALVGVLKHLFSLAQNTQQQAQNVSTLMYTYCSILIPGLQKIISSRPKWFLPKSKTPKLTASIKPVIRLFEYENSRYFLAREMENALGPMGIVFKRPDAGFVDVLEWEAGITIWKGYGKTMDDVDFILVPTTTTKHCFVPIRDGTGLYCKPAAEVLFELLENMFFGFNVFQAPNKRTSDAIVNMFEELDYVCRPNLPEVYFVDNRMIDNLDVQFAKKFQKTTSARNIRDVSPGGFTLEDVKFELKNLQLQVYLTDICQYAELAFQKVQEDKKRQSLRTCDMYDAIRICMLLSVLKKFPKLAQFVHCQKVCHRVHGLKCKDCEKEKLAPKKKQHFMTFFEPRDGRTTLGEHCTANEVGKVYKVDIFDSSIVEEDVPEPEKHVPKPAEKAPKVKKEKEQTTCEKCIRTNDRCQKAKDESRDCKMRMDDIGCQMDTLKYSIKDLKGKEAELQKAVEEKYGNRVALAMEELKVLKIKEDEDLKKIQMMEIQLSNQEKMIPSEERHDLAKMMRDMKEAQEQLQNANALLASENKNKDTKIENLKREIQALQKPRPKAQTPLALPSSSLTSSSAVAVEPPSSNPLLIAQMLHDFQKMKLDLEKSDFLRNVRQKVNRLITLSDDDNVKNTARYELDRVTREFKATPKRLDENIAMIQKNPRISTSHLHKVQKRPAFSAHFLEEYNRAVARESQQGELDDPECLICLQNMEPGEPTVKCSKCRRRYHMECASGWLSTKTVCPTCDRAMLHPAEYPPLN